MWDDPAADWDAYDRVIVRSTWDYTRRAADFLAWCEAVGPAGLRNDPALVRFAADKRYLGELPVPTVPTTFVAPGDPLPALDGEVVVKPNVSAGARDTGRFGERTHDAARALIERIHGSGRVALVQPYLPAVDARGETALVGDLRVAAVMLTDDLVTAGEANEAERALAERIVAEIGRRFGVPLYARVDLVAGPDGESLLLELEVVEPALYLATAPGAAQWFAQAIAGS